MLPKLFQRLKKKFDNSPSQGQGRVREGEMTNGFGAQRMLRSSLPCGNTRRDCLEGVQLLTRYCTIEQPYWSAFIAHYRNLGVRCLHVCVQTASERQELLEMGASDEVELRVHQMPLDGSPSEALRALSVEVLTHDAPFTLMVDCDEFFLSQRPGLSAAQLFDVFPDVSQWHLPWLMRPCLDCNDHVGGGFWGHIGKPLVRSAYIQGVATDHRFRMWQPASSVACSSAPAGMFGFVLVHYWARSFRDCLLKTFFNRFADVKSSDRGRALDLIRSGDLPMRLRLLAFLRVQDGHVALPEILRPSINQGLEEKILRQYLSEMDEERCRHSFDLYCEQLRESARDLPLYPAISLFDLAELLPAPRGAKRA